MPLASERPLLTTDGLPMNDMTRNPRRRPARLRTAIRSGLAAGTGDLLYALLAFVPLGVPPRMIAQSIASGWIGRAAYQGGWLTASLGLVTHYLICMVAAFGYGSLAARAPRVLERVFWSGPLFGGCFFFVMNYVVVPLSATNTRPPQGWFWVGGFLAHLFLVGLPIAWITRHDWHSDRSPPNGIE